MDNFRRFILFDTIQEDQIPSSAIEITAYDSVPINTSFNCAYIPICIMNDSDFRPKGQALNFDFVKADIPQNRTACVLINDYYCAPFATKDYISGTYPKGVFSTYTGGYAMIPGTQQNYTLHFLPGYFDSSNRFYPIFVFPSLTVDDPGYLVGYVKAKVVHSVTDTNTNVTTFYPITLYYQGLNSYNDCGYNMYIDTE